MPKLINKELLNKLIAFRKMLHANPEVSGKEYNTASNVTQFLKTCSPTKIVENIGGTGIVAVFDSEKPGKSVMFRAELDALPIQEINTFQHRSKINGISHKCGHDGHTTVLLGLAKLLSEQKPKNGKIFLLFQPAEEDGEGAKAIFSDPKFKTLKPDYIFAFHNLPGYPLNQIVVKNNSFTAAVKSIIIKINGKTAHAAEPENGLNPALAIADILKETAKLSNNDPNRDDFTLITPVHIEMGEIAYGISAGYGEVRLTIRAWDEYTMEKLATAVIDCIEKTAANYNIRITYSWTHEFYANQNYAAAVDIIKEAAKDLKFDICERKFPFKWGEDFGLFTQSFKGAMFGIGSGEKSPALHNPDYDFPDDILPTAIQLFYQISLHLL
ncbi:amidohydrolase [Lutibacter sp. B1]|uniref:amidohydrolase n=1 Tax=Lutibacter sp. B1 TaxID=2725996 RepID=UPI0014567266|nr:amidohydrolase [Lutibacter sp. B1]NLP57762.1 amidohydrolase [Lutibacter sp. B1]